MICDYFSKFPFLYRAKTSFWLLRDHLIDLFSIEGYPDEIVSRLRVTLRYDRVSFPLFRRSPEFLVCARGLHNPMWLSTEYLFVRAGWAYHTNKVGGLVPAYFLRYLPAQRYLRLVLNAKGCRYGSDKPARCRVHCASDAIT